VGVKLIGDVGPVSEFHFYCNRSLYMSIKSIKTSANASLILANSRLIKPNQEALSWKYIQKDRLHKRRDGEIVRESGIVLRRGDILYLTFCTTVALYTGKQLQIFCRLIYRDIQK
jgi:hypothetical protein